MIRWDFGQAVSTARRRGKRMSQKELARALEDYTGEHWNQAKISRIEVGEQEPTWSEVLAFAAVQEMPLDWYRVGPSLAMAGASAANEANPGQVKRNRWSLRIPRSHGFRPALSF